LLELVESPQGGHDALPGAAVLPAVLDDLEVGSRAQPLKGVMLCTLFGLPESSM